MKKILSFVLALSLSLGMGVAFADQQIDKGQALSTASKKFFVGRYARTGAVATAGANSLSKDMVVIWDTTSKDGVSVLTTTTSGDRSVAGVLMENIPGSSRDNTASQDENQNNWGKVQTWGLHADALSVGNISAGDILCTSGTAGRVASCSYDGGLAVFSRDLTAVGVALETASGGSSTVDMMVRVD